MVIKTVYHLVDSNHEKEEGGVLGVVLPGRRQMTYLGKGRVCLRDEG